MSASTRDRRATVYPYVGKNDGGFVFPAYGDARGTFWCRLSPIPGLEDLLDAQADVRERAVLEFADEAPVVEHDLVVMDDDVQWRVGAITVRRLQRAKIVRVERSTEQLVARTAVAAPTTADTFVDGGHADDDFDNPFGVADDGGDATGA